MENPTVSIVLPTYNGSRYLAQAIESCLGQTFQDWELVIVDDASDDDTPEIIARYAGQDARIRSVRHERNRKLPESLNTGFNLARGDLLTWTSDDNCYRPEALTAMVAFLETHPDVDIVYTDSTIIDEEGNPIQYRRVREPDELPYWNCVGECFLFRRLVFETIGGYDTDWFLVEDYDFWLRAAEHFRMEAFHRNLYRYRVRRGSLSDTRKEQVSRATSALLNRHLSIRHRRHRDQCMAYLRLAREAAFVKARFSALSWMLKAFRASPRSMFHRNALAPIILILFGNATFESMKEHYCRLRHTASMGRSYPFPNAKGARLTSFHVKSKRFLRLALQAARLPEMPALVKVVWDDWRSMHPPDQPTQDRLNGALDWLAAAMDATSQDGISSGFSMPWGWLPSYLETTGYIIPTLYEAARLENLPALKASATRQAEWILSHQRESGGIAGGLGTGGLPLVFDTGQALFGLLSAYRESGRFDFLSAAEKAGSFLLDSLDEQGCFVRNLWLNCVHTYNVRVSWALLLLAEETGRKVFREAAEANLNWTIAQQTYTGFFLGNTFSPDGLMYTHALGYTLRGLVECALMLQRDDLYHSVHAALSSLLDDALNKGFLAGTYDPDWRGDMSWTCLTGNCQIAIVFHRAAALADDPAVYKQAFLQLLHYVKMTQNLVSKHPGVRGGIKGSHPIWGEYQRFKYPNWAAKFFIDALLLEVHGKGGSRG